MKETRLYKDNWTGGEITTILKSFLYSPINYGWIKISLPEFTGNEKLFSFGDFFGSKVSACKTTCFRNFPKHQGKHHREIPTALPGNNITLFSTHTWGLGTGWISEFF